MRRAAAALVLACSIPPPSFAGEKVAKEQGTFGGVQRSYFVAAPKDVRADEKLPLVVAFHGSGRNGESVVEPWTKIARKQRVVVVGPDALDAQMWAFPADGPAPVLELVEAIRRRFPVDPARIYLFGHSAGAVFALRLGLLESETFAAVAVHAGSFRAPADFAVIPSARRKVPMLILAGDLDPYFPPASVDATVQALQQAGIPAESFLMKGHDHWYYTLAPSINAQAWEFLEKHTLPSPPRDGAPATP